jgi:succinoglycan biosynthesis transport protein ExoP
VTSPRQAVPAGSAVKVIEPAPPALAAPGDFARELAATVYRRRRLVLLAIVTASAAAMIVSLLKAPVYEASTTLIADKTPPLVLLSASGRESSLVQQPLAQAPDAFTLSELAKSESVREAATSRLVPPFDPAQVAAVLSQQVRVQQVRTTDLIRISVRDGSPYVAAAAARAMADSVVEQDLRARRRLATIAREFIGKQLDLAGQDLRASEHALAAFKRQSRDVSLSEQTQLDLKKLADLETELAGVKEQEQQVDIGFSRPVGADVRTGPEPPDPVITGLQSQLAALQVEYSGLRQQFTPLHPQVASTEAKIEETRRRLSAEIARRQAALREREQSVAAEISALKSALADVPARQATLARLSLEAQDRERAYLLLSEKFQEARIAEGSIGSALRVVDAAKVPKGPAGPPRRLAVILGLAAGLLVGVGAAVAADQLEPAVLSVKDAERAAGAAVIGAVPALGPVRRASPAEPGIETPPLLSGRSAPPQALEAWRAVRTRLLRLVRDTGAKSVLFAAVAPGEGATTIAANFALAAAQADRRVCLVDCNLRRPAVARLFPEAASSGLSAYLSGRAALAEVNRPTHQAGLSCIAGGPAADDPAALLDTELLGDLLREAGAGHELVVLDGASFVEAVETEGLALRAGAVVLVAQAGHTDRLGLSEVRHRLAGLGVGVLGVVVNAAPHHHPAASFRALWREADWRTRWSMLAAALR